MNRPDETLEEIWEIRRQIAKEFSFDPKKRAAYYQKMEKDSGAKIFSRVDDTVKPSGPSPK
jgi:hypothetical protein